MAGRAPGPARWWRLQPCSRNPLMRGSDRVESVIVIVVLMLVLMLVPISADVGSETFTSLQQQSRHLAAASRPVPAVLLDDAAATPTVEPAIRVADSGARGWVRWTVEGREHTGMVPVPPGAKTGDTVTVQVDSGGDLVDISTGTENAVMAVSTACGVWAAGTATGGLVLSAMHRALVRHRLRRWEQAWEKFAASTPD